MTSGRAPKLPPLIARRPTKEGAMIPRPDLDYALESLESKLSIAVIHGASNLKGGSVIHRTYNPRSWKSYGSVARDLVGSLRRLGFTRVRRMREGMDLPQLLREAGIHMAWLNTGGIQGHGAMCHAAASLESLGIPYVGHRPTVAALLDDKPLFKQWLQGIGVPTAPFAVWHPSTAFSPSKRRLQELEELSGGPLVVKPASGRASQHVHWIRSADQAREAVRWVYGHTRDRVLIEPFLPGRELCITVAPPIQRLEHRFQMTSRPRFLAPIERLFDDEEKIFTSMDVQPIGIRRVQALTRPEHAVDLQWLESVGERIFNELQLSALIRLDVREDRQGHLMVLEANPKPDLAVCKANGEGSLIALGLKEQGESYDELIASLLAYRLALGFDFCLPSLAVIPDLLTDEGDHLGL